MGHPSLGGLWPAIATPFGADGAVDAASLVAFGRGLLAEGSAGLVVLGTTGEASSLGLAERHTLIDVVVEGGIEPGQLIVGTGAPSLVEAADLTRHAGDIGAAAVMLLPPFYFKPVSDDGLFAFVAEVIARTGPSPPQILLYHYPALAGVGWSFELVAALSESFPEVVVGLKDSSGDEVHTLNLVTAFPELAIFAGSEGHLSDAMAAGAAGLISANANVNARALAELIGDPAAPDATARLAEANAVRGALKARGLVPSIKAVLAARTGDDTWRALRPPLMPLSAEDEAALLAEPAIERLLAADRG
jgi:4-hydroxy-tetrahydrodipicolinate synthase